MIKMNDVNTRSLAILLGISLHDDSEFISRDKVYSTYKTLVVAHAQSSSMLRSSVATEGGGWSIPRPPLLRIISEIS